MIIFFIILFIVAMLLLMGGISLAFVGGLLAAYGVIKYLQFNSAEPTPSACPNCKSEDIRFSASSASSGLIGSLMIKASNTVATCQNCGHTFEYATSTDIENARKKAITNIIIGVVVLIIGIILIKQI